MKLLQMLKLTKLRKLLSRKPRVTEKVERAGTTAIVQSDEELVADLTRKDCIGAALSQIMQDRTVGDFARWRGGYSDQTLEALLVERGADIIEGPVCRKANPTVLITKRPEYRRKVNGEYQINSTPIIPSVANGRVVIS